MKTTHHPGAECLMSCSAGSMPEAFAAIMATHMAMCPQCQKDLAIMEHIGTVLFDKIAPAAVAKPAPVAAMMAREAEPDGTALPAAEGDVPATLVASVGHHLDKVSWSRVSPGVWQHRIPLSKGAKGDLRLIKVAPGQKIPQHAHSGEEMTLVLRGAYDDETGRYEAGDVADFYGDVDHAPVADAEAGCICLSATMGRMKFKSPLARLIQPLTGF
jgi:putative transcriptional regulator